jgi:hypothetical protein
MKDNAIDITPPAYIVRAGAKSSGVNQLVAAT